MVRGEEGIFYFFLLLLSSSAPSESVLLQWLIFTDLFPRSLFLALQPIQIILRFWTFFRALGIIYDFSGLVSCSHLGGEFLKQIRPALAQGEFFALKGLTINLAGEDRTSEGKKHPVINERRRI